MAQAAQVFHVQVANASAMECRSDAVSIKLRIVAGTRNGAHIDESLHSVGLQEGNEILLRARRVADRQHDSGRPLPSGSQRFRFGAAVNHTPFFLPGNSLCVLRTSMGLKPVVCSSPSVGVHILLEA